MGLSGSRSRLYYSLLLTIMGNTGEFWEGEQRPLKYNFTGCLVSRERTDSSGAQVHTAARRLFSPPIRRAVPLLGVYLKKHETLNQRDIYIHMFVAVLFTIAKIQKQPKGPSIHERIKNWCMYTMEYGLAKERKRKREKERNESINRSCHLQ